MTFEIHGLILALHYEARFLKTPGSIDRANTGFAHIVARYGSQDDAPANPAKVSRITRSGHSAKPVPATKE